MSDTLYHVVAGVFTTAQQRSDFHQSKYEKRRDLWNTQNREKSFFQLILGMDIETAEQPYSIRIPLTDSDQCIELFVDELGDNTDELTQTLFGENVHPHYWIQIAVN